MVDAEADPAGIVGDVVDAVGRRPAKFGNQEVVHSHRHGLSLRTILTAGILEVTDQLLLLGIDRDRRLTRRQRLFHLCIDVAELDVAVGMVRPFERLAIGLQAVAHVTQQIGHHVMANAVAEFTKPTRKLAQALRRPQ